MRQTASQPASQPTSQPAGKPANQHVTSFPFYQHMTNQPNSQSARATHPCTTHPPIHPPSHPASQPASQPTNNAQPCVNVPPQLPQL